MTIKHALNMLLFLTNYKFIFSGINANIVSLQSKKEGKGLEQIQSSTTPDSGYRWESDNVTIRLHKREPRDQSSPSR